MYKTITSLVPDKHSAIYFIIKTRMIYLRIVFLFFLEVLAC